MYNHNPPDTHNLQSRQQQTADRFWHFQTAAGRRQVQANSSPAAALWSCSKQVSSCHTGQSVRGRPGGSMESDEAVEEVMRQFGFSPDWGFVEESPLEQLGDRGQARVTELAP